MGAKSKIMTMLLVFGILAVIVLSLLTRLALHHYRMLKNRTYSIKDVKRTFSSLGIIFPIEFVLIYLLLNLNGLQGILNSVFGIRADIILSLIGQNALIVNILSIFSTITLGSSVALSITVSVTAAVFYIKSKKEKESTHFDRVTLIPSNTNDTTVPYAYLQLCRLLS